MKCLLVIVSLAFPKISSNKNISKVEIKESIINHGVKWPDLCYAQARIETGNFKSKFFKKYNNLFGMKISSRKMHSYKTRNNYCIYFSWQKSIEDYKKFQDKFEKREDFENYLKHNYGSNKKYWKLINSVLNKDEFVLNDCVLSENQINY